ncbi:MAG TPA: hypothetical protein VIF62_09170 [Labilithrix sp.]
MKKLLAAMALVTAACGGGGSDASDGELGAQGEELSTHSIPNIDDALPWSTCGNCANTGASGATAYTSFVHGSKSEDGTGVLNAVGEGIPGANHPPYGDAYWWKEHGALPSLVRSVDYYLDLYVPSNADPQGIEFEVQQTIGDRVYNFAWQDDYAENEWRVFQYGGPGAGRWIASGLSATRFTPNTWHSIHAHYSVDTSTSPDTIRHDYLEIDGHRFTTNAKVVAWHSPKPRGSQLSNAVQLDMRAVPCTAGSSPSCQQGKDGKWRVGIPFHVYWDKIHVTYAL